MAKAAKATQQAPQYVRIAEILIGQMERGVLRPGDRAPSLRKLGQQQRVSVTTALQSYMWLENRGYLEARARSGFFVRQPFATEIPEPKFEAGIARERKLGMDDVLSDVFRTGRRSGERRLWRGLRESGAFSRSTPEPESAAHRASRPGA